MTQTAAGNFTREQLAEMATHYQTIAAQQGTKLMRFGLALRILREFGGLGGGWHGGVVATIREWIDSGMDEPIPWPGGAFWDEWAAGQGISNIDGCVGYRLTMRLTEDAHHAH